MSTYRRPSEASIVSDDGTFISSVEHQISGQPATAPPPPIPLPPLQPPPPPPPVFRHTEDFPPSRYDDSGDEGGNERYDDRPSRRRTSPSPSPRGRTSSRKGSDASRSPQSYSRRDVTPAPSARRYPEDSDSGSDYIGAHRNDRSDRSESPVSPVMSQSSNGGEPALPKAPRAPSPPAGRERPRMTSTVNYKGPDGRSRKASLIISDDGAAREEDIPIEFDSDSDRDLPAGVESSSYQSVGSANRRPPVVAREDRNESPGVTSDEEYGYSDAEQDAKPSRKRTMQPKDSPSTDGPRRKGVSFGEDTKPPAPAAESDSDSVTSTSPRASPYTGNVPRSGSSPRPPGSSSGKRLGGGPGFEILPSITSAVRLPAITLSSRSGGVAIALILALFFIPELLPFRFLPLIIPGLITLASLSSRINELEYMCLSVVFFLDNGLLRAFLPSSTPLRAFLIVALQALGCSRWNGRLVVERALRLWVR